jgi:hypothetical protein
METRTLVAVFVCVLVALYLWMRADFVIRVRQGRCECRGLLPRAWHKELADFLLDDLNLKGPIKVLGKRVRGRLILWYRGSLTPGQRQRVRNFLLTRH